MFVVIGNPPYNVETGQRKRQQQRTGSIQLMDSRVRETYGTSLHSDATKISIGGSVCEGDSVGIGPDWSDEGVVAFVTNNSFLDGVAFDGMRKHLADDFDAIYILDLEWECPQESKTLRDNAQRLWDSGGGEHQFFHQKPRQRKFPSQNLLRPC